MRYCHMQTLVTVVVIAAFAVVFYVAGQVCCDKFFNIAAAAADNFDALRFKYVLGALPHIPSKHHHHSHLSENRCYSALASTAFR